MIQAISTNNYSTFPSFKSTGRFTVKNGIRYSNRTSFFRGDLAWNAFTHLLAEKYKNTPKVNVVNFACSDGSEPWSLAIILMEKLKAAAQKFFPIHAMDFDEEIVQRAKNQPCGLSDKDLYMINGYTNDKYANYLNIKKSTETKYQMAVRPNEKLESNVIFDNLTLQDSVKKIQPQNNVIMCRNMWAYLNNQDRELLKETFKKLDSSSTIVIGQLDNGHHLNQILQDIGFKEHRIGNVYIKP